MSETPRLATHTATRYVQPLREGGSLPAVVDYVTFMKVESSAYLKIRFDWLFSIYVVFAVAIIVRYLWLCGQAIWGKAPEAYDPSKAGSGV